MALFAALEHPTTSIKKSADPPEADMTSRFLQHLTDPYRQFTLFAPAKCLNGSVVRSYDGDLMLDVSQVPLMNSLKTALLLLVVIVGRGAGDHPGDQPR